MRQKTREKIKSEAIVAIFGLIVTLIGVFVAHLLTRSTTEQDITQTLSKYFSFIDSKMSYEVALEAVYEEVQIKDATINQLTEENEKLQAELNIIQAERSSETAISSALTSAQSYAASNNYETALAVLSSVSQEDARIISALGEYQSRYEQHILEQVNTLLDESEFEKANDLLSHALSIIPNTSIRLQEMYERVQNIEPISISQTVCIDSKNWTVNDGTPIDIFGNTHYSDYYCVVYNSNSIFGDNDNYAEYRTYGKYTTLTGTISPYQYIEGATVKIYFDDSLKITYEIGKKTDPINFEFDVSGVDYIRFEVQLLWSSGVIFSDVYLCTI